MEFLQFYTLEIEDRERIVVNDDLVFKGPEVPDKIDENRELDRLEVKTLKFSFHLFFNPSPNSNSPPLDSIIPTQVKSRKCLLSEDRESSAI